MAYADKTIAYIEREVEAIREEAKELPEKVREAVERWADVVAADARAGLARPRWLLTRYIRRKVKTYQSGQKIWAMVGFQFRVKGDKRDPGYYGQFHEGGWAPAGHKVTAPKKFIKKAKKKNLPALQREIDDLFGEITKRLK